jgi:FkbM family methyltransferase
MCARYGNISRARHRLRIAIRFLIGLFAEDGEVLVRFRFCGLPDVAFLRKNNESDYLVLGKVVMGAYSLEGNRVKTPTLIIDGGANIGIFSILAKAAFPEAVLTCYEPDSGNLRHLKRNLEANGISATVLEKGLWSTTADLFFHPAESYCGEIRAEFSPFSISCELPETPSGTLLKLDIEGAEHEVIPALFEARRFPETIFLEIHDFPARGESLMQLLASHGYQWRESFSPAEYCVNISATRDSPKA